MSDLYVNTSFLLLNFIDFDDFIFSFSSLAPPNEIFRNDLMDLEVLFFNMFDLFSGMWLVVSASSISFWLFSNLI